MTLQIRLPQFGMAMQEGTIVHWFKQEGETVEAGELLAEVEAAKSVEELVAPQAGTLQRILVPPGVTVPVHELLALLTPAGEDANDESLGHPAEVGRPGATAAADGPVPASASTGQVTPRARRLAKQLGVDLGSVVGTGPGGRIVEDDVSARTAARPPGLAAPRQPLAMTAMRRIVAERMHTSLQSSAQFTLMTTCDVTDLVAFRERWASAGGASGPRPTYLDLVVKAVALALREHPRLNATLEDGVIHLLPDIHVGVATALDDGLVVPVVRHADGKALDEIVVESARLIERARAGTYTLDEISGSTFSVSSLGGLGIDAFTPILNPPEVAILGVGRIVEQPVRAGDGFVWRQAMTLSLTVDHRLVDGAPGAAFLQTVGALLGAPHELGPAPLT